MPLRVLLTGYGAFPGAPINPTQVIVARCAERQERFARLGIALQTAILPVEFDAVPDALARLLDTASPDVVLHLGLAARRKRIAIETRAANRVCGRRPDAAGRHPVHGALLAGGPAFRHSTFPAARLVASLDRHAAPTSRSIDAGDYVCNQTLYLSLADAGRVTGFIHVPRPVVPVRRQVDGDASRRVTLDAMVQAVERAIVISAVHARGLKHDRRT